MCSLKLKSVIIGSNGQQLAILGLSKLVVLLIKRVFHLSFKKTTINIIDYMMNAYIWLAVMFLQSCLPF